MKHKYLLTYSKTEMQCYFWTNNEYSKAVTLMHNVLDITENLLSIIPKNKHGQPYNLKSADSYYQASRTHIL